MEDGIEEEAKVDVDGLDGNVGGAVKKNKRNKRKGRKKWMSELEDNVVVIS